MDPNSSPKSSSSSSSSSSEEEEDHKSISAVHPGSPSNAHQSSDESTSSDGVLVELPHNPDHDTRQGDPDGGILVNIDGSMQEGREDLFVDAPDELVSGRSSGLEDSLAVIDYGESSGESSGSRAGSPRDELARTRDRMDEALAQCRKYKEEREVFGREVLNLRHQLREIFGQQSVPGISNEESVDYLRWIGNSGGEDEVLMSPTPLHSMVNDCSKILSHLKSNLDGQLNSVDTIKGLNSVLFNKEKEVEDLNWKLTESNVCQDVVISYMGSICEIWSTSLKESSDAREELHEKKRKEAYLMEKINTLEDERRRMAEEINKLREGLEIANAETNKTKLELEQAENKLAGAREKLSIAVTKGKSLVQHRDALKQSITEKTTELEKCMLELNQQSSAFKASEARIEELNQLLVNKTNEFEKCMMELQQKSTMLASIEITAMEKTSELEKCLLELQQKSEALEKSETNCEELKQLLAEKNSELNNLLLELQQKSDAFEATEASAMEMRQTLSEKSIELENCLQKLQQMEISESIIEELKISLAEKTNELEKCMMESQQKSDALKATENSAEEKTIELENCMQKLQQIEISGSVIEELKMSLSEKTFELEKCFLELKQKSDALEASEVSAEELRQTLGEKTIEHENCIHKLQQLEISESIIEELKMSLSEKTNELDKCQLELKQKINALQASEVSADELRQTLSEKTTELENCLRIIEELRMSLTEKTNELEKCLLELEKKSDTLQTATITTEELQQSQHLVDSLQESLSKRDQILQEIEEMTQHIESSEDLPSKETVDRVRWFIKQKHKLDGVLLDINKIKDALSAIELPDSISSTVLDSQIYWLVKSFTQAKEDIVKLHEEINGSKLAGASHESELFEAHKEIDRLAALLSELKQEKGYVQDAHESLKLKYEKLAQNLSLISHEGVPVTELTERSISSLDDQDLLIEKCMAAVSQRMNTLEEMQSLLFVKCQEHKLCENMLQEEVISQSEIRAMSTELGRAAEEVNTLKSEKEALQKELERVEERSSLIREKLSLAVKKGKGLVQEREGFKHSLDEKNSEIEKFKQQIQLQESAIVEHKEQIKNLSEYPVLVQKLESDIEQSKKLLLESNNMLQTLAESIEEIVLPTDKVFKKPVEKVYWIAEYIHDSEISKAHMGKELEEVKPEVTLQASRLAEALATIKSLEDELYNIIEEKKNIEQELEKLKDVSSLQANRLEDAYATIKSLEGELGKMSLEEELENLKRETSVQNRRLEEAHATIKSLREEVLQASNSISILEEAKMEIKSKSKEEIVALNEKLAECMKELVGTRNSLLNQSDQIVSHLGNLQMLLKDEGLFSLMTEEFRKKIEGLRHMGILIQDLHIQFNERGPHIDTGSEYDFVNLFSSLPKFEDFISEETLDIEMSTEDLRDVKTLSKIVEGLHSQAKLFGNRFQSLSRYVDDHITTTLQALQAARDEFMHMLEFSESLKLSVKNLEAQNKAQELKMSSLEKDITALISACGDATQELEIDFNESLELGQELDITRLGPGSRTTEASVVGGEYAKAIESLSLAAKRTRIQAQKLMNVNKGLADSVNDLKNKIKQAELTTESAIQDRQLSQQRSLKLERDLEELQSVCNEMKERIEDYQDREDMLRDKEAELSSLQTAIASKDRGESLISESQVEALFNKVNKLVISQEVHLSTPVEKLFYLLNQFSEMQRRLDSLTYANEDMQLIIESHVREIEDLKKAFPTVGTNFEELELKKLDLIELTVGLEKIIQRFGGENVPEEQKPATAKGLLSMLERLMITSNTEIESFKSRLQELGGRLQVKEKAVNELSAKNKMLEDSVYAQFAQTEIVKERTNFDASTSVKGPEISEIEDVGPPGKNSVTPAAAHARTMRKGSNDHLVLSIDADSDPLVPTLETDDKGHVFKSLNTSGLIPKQGKLIADRVDGIWVSGGRILMNRPRARLGLIAYWIFLHLWLLGSIL